MGIRAISFILFFTIAIVLAKDVTEENSVSYFFREIDCAIFFAELREIVLVFFPFTQCGNCKIFLSFRIYVKSISESHEGKKLPFLQF